MKCRKCGATMRKRIIEPFGIKRPVTVYECVSALCEYDEHDDCRSRQQWSWPHSR